MKTNDLKFTISKVVNDINIKVSIRLNDECKNGHQDFSIAGDIYEAGKPKSDRYHIASGCIHDEIEEYFPEFKKFIDLHLSDLYGNPMYAVANGYYHLKRDKKVFMNYMRCTEEQYNYFKDAYNQDYFAYLLFKSSLPEQWKAEANNAIVALEELTGNPFVNDSVKSQYQPLKPEEIKKHEILEKEGYYTKKEIRKRVTSLKREKLNKKIETLKQNVKDKKKELDYDLFINILLLKKGFESSSAIFYNHTSELCFNWSTTKTTKEQFEKFVNSLTAKDYAKMPKDIKIKLNKES